MRKSVKAIAILIVLGLFVAGSAFAQTAGDPDPASIGIDTAQQKLREISVSKFENPGFWTVDMPIDNGVISARRHEGAPLDKEAVPGEEEAGIQEADNYVLGIKAEFFKRGHAEINIKPVRPLAVEGIVKTVSLWVVGRNYNHDLVLLVADHFGNVSEINMGKLNFTGWKKLTVAIPTGIVQRDYHYNNRSGIRILGFRIDCDLSETYGTYYMYFDDLRAVTDLFAEESRDIDDMADNW